MRSALRRLGSLSSGLAWLAIVLVVVAACSAIGAHPAQAATVALDAHRSLSDSLLVPALFAIGTIGTEADMVIYQAEFQTGMVESITQFLAAFNEASRGAIVLVPNALKGHYSKGAFFKDVSGLVSRRDITSTGAATILPMTQDEQIGVKLNRKIGPVAQTLDAMKKAGLSQADASRVFGEMAATRKMKDMLNSALIACETAIQNVSANNLDITGESTKTATPDALNRTLAKFGDNAQAIVCWIAHSKVDFDIVGKLISDKVTGLADLVTLGGPIPAYLGRNRIVTDSPALTDANGSATDTYNTLGLVAGAVKVEESEEETYFTQVLGGAENLYQIFQAEYAYNVTVKGHKWDTTNGGINPADAALGTTTNWDKVASDDKNCAGVRLVSQ